MRYTVVQHSASLKGNGQFERGLETRAVDTRAKVQRVQRAGGVIFDSYMQAEDFAYAEQYPPGYYGLVPEAQGEFAKSVVDGLRIYVPVKVDA